MHPAEERSRACGPAARGRERARSVSGCQSTSGERACRPASRPRGAWYRTCAPTSRSAACRRICRNFLELDLSGMSLNETKFLADIPLPAGVTIPELTQRNAAGRVDPCSACRGARAGCRGGRRRRACRGCRACRCRCSRRSGRCAACGGPGAAPAAPARPRRVRPGRARRKRRPAPARKEGGQEVAATTALHQTPAAAGAMALLRRPATFAV